MGQSPIEGQSHQCDGRKPNGRKCRQIVRNDSDHCENGHKNTIRHGGVSDRNRGLSSFNSTAEVEDLVTKDQLGDPGLVEIPRGETKNSVIRSHLLSLLRSKPLLNDLSALMTEVLLWAGNEDGECVARIILREVASAMIPFEAAIHTESIEDIAEATISLLMEQQVERSPGDDIALAAFMHSRSRAQAVRTFGHEKLLRSSLDLAVVIARLSEDPVGILEAAVLKMDGGTKSTETPAQAALNTIMWLAGAKPDTPVRLERSAIDTIFATFKAPGGANCTAGTMFDWKKPPSPVLSAYSFGEAIRGSYVLTREDRLVADYGAYQVIKGDPPFAVAFQNKWRWQAVLKDKEVNELQRHCLQATRGTSMPLKRFLAQRHITLNDQLVRSVGLLQPFGHKDHVYLMSNDKTTALYADNVALWTGDIANHQRTKSFTRETGHRR